MTEAKLGRSSGTNDIWDLVNTFSGSNNNGNVLSQLLTVPGASIPTSYRYDPINRLSVAAENRMVGLSMSWARRVTKRRVTIMMLSVQ